MLALSVNLLEIVGLINLRVTVVRESFELSRWETNSSKMLRLLLRIRQRRRHMLLGAHLLHVLVAHFVVLHNILRVIGLLLLVPVHASAHLLWHTGLHVL